ncbi:hypothetical protein ACPJHQ_06135 [Rossellomorea sp. H39__3]
MNATLSPNPGTLTGLVQDTGANPLAGVNITVTTSSGTGVIVATTVTGRTEPIRSQDSLQGIISWWRVI